MKQHDRCVGIMGGTFDPVHIGHLMLAQHALEQFKLDVVYMMPNGTPAYKSDHKVTDARVRLAMTECAIADNPELKISPVEVEREGNTYTYQTLEYLRQVNPDDRYFFIIGADSMFHFDTWKEPHTIAENCVLIVANRDHTPDVKLKMCAEHLRQVYGADIRFLDCPAVDISSEMIRKRVMEGRSIRYYVPDSVVRFIKEHGVYHR